MPKGGGPRVPREPVPPRDKPPARPLSLVWRHDPHNSGDDALNHGGFYFQELYEVGATLIRITVNFDPTSIQNSAALVFIREHGAWRRVVEDPKRWFRTFVTNTETGGPGSWHPYDPDLSELVSDLLAGVRDTLDI